jgi:hypothetical protein
MNTTSGAALDPRYPVGRFDVAQQVPRSERQRLITTIAELPTALRAAVRQLDDAQLDTPYRDGGWTVRQLVHHVADSHLNASIRFRLALTEDSPGIRTYMQERWAELADARSAPVAVSLALLDALHERWVFLLRSMSDGDFDRTLEHPEWGRLSLWTMLLLYEWHSRHHVAHVLRLRERTGW